MAKHTKELSEVNVTLRTLKDKIKKADLSSTKSLILVLSVALGWAPISQAEPLFAKETALSRHPNEQVIVSEFGLSVAIDGDIAVVGAHGNESAYVFVRSGSGWARQAKLIASDGRDGDDFGFTVAIKGETVVVGAPAAGSFQSGAAYVFERIGDRWSQQAKLIANDVGQFFGQSVAIDGGTIVAGRELDDDKGSNAGAAYVFIRGTSGWRQQTKLLARDGKAMENFGRTVAIDRDTILVGAPKGDAAYVFVRRGDGWSQQAKLKSENGAAGSLFGNQVAVAGDVAVVSANLDDESAEDSGSVYVFIRDDGKWNQKAKLRASDGAAGDHFGSAVAVNRDKIVVGASKDDAGSGSVYVFLRQGNSWKEEQKIRASDSSAGNAFGFRAAIDGIAVLIGAPSSNRNGTASGAAYAFEAAQLAVSMTVLPGGDPGRFNILIDNVMRRPNASDGAATGPMVLSPGDHVVGQTAGIGTKLDDYTLVIGGDCSSNGRVVALAGQKRECTITNTAKSGAVACLEGCEQGRDRCLADGIDLPSVCAQIFNSCKLGCPQ